MPDPRFAYDWDALDTATVATVGPPGQRTFLLQVSRQRRVLTMGMEKEQAAAMAAGLARLLNLLRREDPEHAAGLEASGASMALIHPLEEAFRIGNIGLGVDEAAHKVLLVLHELGFEDPDEDDEEGQVPEGLPPGLRARLALSYVQALDLVQHIPTVVSGGRPNCPACGEPLDEGHRCQRRNGHH